MPQEPAMQGLLALVSSSIEKSIINFTNKYKLTKWEPLEKSNYHEWISTTDIGQP